MLQKDEEEVRVICEEKRNPPLTKAQIKEALITKIKLEIESEKKLKNVRVPSQDHAKQLMMFERTKVMDQVYITHGVKLFEIMAGNKEFNLEEDEDVKAIKNASRQEREQMQEEAKKKMMLGEEDMVTVKAACEELGEIGDISTDLSGMMDFDIYVKIFVVIVKLQVTILKTVEDKAKAERMVHLETKD